MDLEFSEVHPNLEHLDFWPHFNDCIGAIHGTHVKVVVPKSKTIQYLNMHNETSQNVLAICDFDMRFTFVLSGWVHDLRVFKDAMTTHAHQFSHTPPGKLLQLSYKYFYHFHLYFYVSLCTCLCREVLCGWCGIPKPPGLSFTIQMYKVPCGAMAKRLPPSPPQGMKETFNHAYSQARNVIEGSFGILKMKWRMLLNMHSFP